MSATLDTIFVDVVGQRLEVRRIAGAPGRPTIVFLHEGLGSLSAWRDFPERVARETSCPALIYSRAGYGRSSPAALPRAPDFMHREARDVLPALLTAEHVEEPILFGHSGGASIALLYAALSGWADVWLLPEFRRWNIEQALPHVRAPALVIQGDRDEYGTLSQVEAIERRAGGPVERLWLSGAGHSPHRDRPDEVLAAAGRLIRAHS